jgi:hypothetical protein
VPDAEYRRRYLELRTAVIGTLVALATMAFWKWMAS